MPVTKELAAGVMVRPLLGYNRLQLEEYAQQQQLRWVEDESNQDITYTRNYLRQEVMPLLCRKWPGLVANLNRTAQHCQEAKLNLEALATIDVPDLEKLHLSCLPLQPLSRSRQANILRLWLKKNNIKPPSTAIFNRLHAEVILAKADANPCVSWDDVSIRRYQDNLYLIKNFPEDDSEQDVISQAVQEGLVIPILAKVEVRYRQGGESLRWHQQTKSLKKLFQSWEIPPWEREKVPLIYINNQLAAVVGYAIGDEFSK
jgi:tRNA(Ile)-lysidine synthase